MKTTIKKLLVISLLICFLASLTVATVSAKENSVQVGITINQGTNNGDMSGIKNNGGQETGGQTGVAVNSGTNNGDMSGIKNNDERDGGYYNGHKDGHKGGHRHEHKDGHKKCIKWNYKCVKHHGHVKKCCEDWKYR